MKNKRGTDGIPGADPNGIPGNPEYAGKVNQAVKYYYLIRLGFNGVVRRGVSFSAAPNKPLTLTLGPDWDTLSSRIAETIIHNTDFRQILKKYDTPKTFFYLDPPYPITLKRQDYYQHNLTEKEHNDLPAVLGNLKGKFLLSMEDNKRTREQYSDYHTTNPAPGELFITNYDTAENQYYNLPAKCKTAETAKNWAKPPCPYCSSRRVQAIYIRVSLPGGKRNYKNTQDLYCTNCNKPIMARKGMVK